MPLVKSTSPKAIGPNIKAEQAAGKPYKQALAIALSTQDRARRADGGATPDYYARNQQWVTPGQHSYNTGLAGPAEQQFEGWVKSNHVPFDPSAPTSDYDMRGFWSALQSGDQRATTAVDPNDQQMHYPDYWKTPYHQTFSNESQWATPDAPHWDGDKLTTKDGSVLFDDAQQQKRGGVVQKIASGGLAGASMPSPARSAQRDMGHDSFHANGLFHGDTAGRTDRLARTVPADSFVFPADSVSSLGQGNTLAGAKILNTLLSTKGPYGVEPLKKRADGGGVGISHVMVAGGELLGSPRQLKNIGYRLRKAGKSKAKTDLEAGHEWARHMVDEVRKHQKKFLASAPKPKK